MSAEVITRPESVLDEHLTYLDQLRESGQVNMFGAKPYLTQRFGMTRATATEVWTYWTTTFSDRHP